LGQSLRGTPGAAAAESLGAGVGVAALAGAVGAAEGAAEGAALALAAVPAPFSGSLEQAVSAAQEATMERNESASRLVFDIADEPSGPVRDRSTGHELCGNQR
jgi:hypothetical protein